MKIIIEVEKNYLEITNADTQTATVAVRSFCNMLKTRQPVESKTKLIIEPKVKELPENQDKRKSVKTTPNLQNALINHENPTTATNSIETIRFTNTEPPIPLYRSNYNCPTCGHKGARFIRETNNYLKCHNCDAQLEVEKTVPNSDFMESDDEGFFFTATELFGLHRNIPVLFY